MGISLGLLFIPVPSFPLARGLMYFSFARILEEVQDAILSKEVSNPFTYIANTSALRRPRHNWLTATRADE